MNKVLAMVLAGGRGERLSILTAERAKPGLPFAGKYRIIDFTLSNCVNSGIFNVAVLAQYNPRSLAQHIGLGKSWDLDRAEGGLLMLYPYETPLGASWYRGTADALRQNLNVVEEKRASQVLVLAGDHIYTMRYEPLLAFHREKRADVTMALTRVPPEEASRFGMVEVNSEGSVHAFWEKPTSPKGDLGSMGIYVFEKDFLMACLKEQAGDDFGKDIIPKLLGQSRLFGYPFTGYWRDIGTVDAYFQASMDLIVDLPPFNLYDPEVRVRTAPQGHPPVKTGPMAHISRSLVAEGAIINGWVENSILSYGVYVEEGAVVRDSIIFDNTVVSRGASIRHCVVDKEVQVGEWSCLGWGEDFTPNHEEPHLLHSGITLVGKGARIPPSVRIGRNCKIAPRVREVDFPGDFIPSGSTIGRRPPLGVR